MLLNDFNFWDLCDYDRSKIQVAYNEHGTSILMDRDSRRPNYADYSQDPLDHNLVNAELEVIIKKCTIILKCIKDCKAGEEILISFSKASWVVYLGYSKFKYSNDLLIKKAKEVYNIKDDFVNSIINFEKVSKIIKNKIVEFDSWPNGVIYYLTHFIRNNRGSSYLNAVYQCLSHVPALTRLIIETNIFEDMITNKKDTNLSHYITKNS